MEKNTGFISVNCVDINIVLAKQGTLDNHPSLCWHERPFKNKFELNEPIPTKTVVFLGTQVPVLKREADEYRNMPCEFQNKDLSPDNDRDFPECPQITTEISHIRGKSLSPDNDKDFPE